MRQKIKDVIAKELSLTEVDDNASIKLLGEDSLGRIELLFAVETAVGKKLTEDDIFQIETINDLVEILEKKN